MSNKSTLDEILDQHAQEYKAGHQDKLKQQLSQLIDSIIGEDVTQQERHWVSNVWGDVCGKDDATRHEHCICEQLNGSKAEQRARAKERGIDL